MSVEAIDVVTADGELVRADEQQNTDLLWAARGAGPGFFGIVTGFHVRLQRRPRVTANALVTYPSHVLGGGRSPGRRRSHRGCRARWS